MSDLAATLPVSRREILRLGWPAMVAALLEHAFRPLDMYWVQWLGVEAQGALGATTFVVILAWALIVLISSGAAPLVARATGAGDPHLRRRVVGSALVGAAAVAVLLAVAGWFLARPISGWLGLTGQTALHATAYLRMLFMTGAALVFSPLVDSTFNAMGRTRLPMALQGTAVVLNGVLTPFFLFRAGMGVEGAALGSTLAQTLSALLGVYLLARATGLGLGDLGTSELRRILRIGSPIALSVALYAAVYWALLATSVSPMGPAVNAALGIGFSALESFSWPAFLGLSVAASSLVGRFLGARRPDEAWRTVHLLLLPAMVLGFSMWALFWFAGRPLTGVFSHDAEAWEQAALYAAVLAWSQPLVAFETLFEGVLGGAGDTRALFYTTVPFNLLRVPLAWVLAFPLGFGAAGIWWAINVTTAMKVVAKAEVVRRGRWSALEI